ncbi:MAG: nitroreductase family deazaflavin-dependent oxidoreductase [Pseudonocardiaceae bacterium]|nr:nitroreductase family deazaflavin-dependent oxidoreductase [Pseudonocardiaceae bacterium]
MVDTGDIDRAQDSPAGWVADHVRRYVETGGAEGHEWKPGVPTLVLATTGRRSGQPRRTGLIYGRDGEDFVVIASKGGAPEHPAWYTNLQADPQAAIQVGEDRFQVLARTADVDEKARLWPQMARVWPDYDTYMRKTDRDIPVVLLQRTA